MLASDWETPLSDQPYTSSVFLFWNVLPQMGH